MPLVFVLLLGGFTLSQKKNDLISVRNLAIKLSFLLTNVDARVDDSFSSGNKDSASCSRSFSFDKELKIVNLINHVICHFKVLRHVSAF